MRALMFVPPAGSQTCLGIGLNIEQEVWARGRLRKLDESTRPQATVVREGASRSIDPAEVVRVDILGAAPGDPIPADGQVLGEGQIVLDESMLSGDPRQHSRHAGEAVYAGSICIVGHASCKAQKVGDEHLIASLTGGLEAGPEELTPLERTIKRLLGILLVVFSLLLFVDYFTRLLPRMYAEAAVNAANVIFGLAPAGLFFMIVVDHAMSTYGLMRAGALVHHSRSVESLARATVIYPAQEGFLTGIGVEMEPIEDSVLRSSSCAAPGSHRMTACAPAGSEAKPATQNRSLFRSATGPAQTDCSTTHILQRLV